MTTPKSSYERAEDLFEDNDVGQVAELLDQLKRFEEREPLVQALLAAVDQVDSDAVRYGFGKVMSAVSDLEAFKL